LPSSRDQRCIRLLCELFAKAWRFVKVEQILAVFINAARRSRQSAPLTAGDHCLKTRRCTFNDAHVVAPGDLAHSVWHILREARVRFLQGVPRNKRLVRHGSRVDLTEGPRTGTTFLATTLSRQPPWFAPAAMVCRLEGLIHAAFASPMQRQLAAIPKSSEFFRDLRPANVR